MTAQTKQRKRLWIDTQLQSRFVLPNVIFLLLFILVSCGVIYLGIWLNVTRAFSEVRLQEDIQTITRIREYEAARTRQLVVALPFFKEEASMLSAHQLAVLSDIIVRTNRNLIPVILFLFVFVVMSSIIVSHRIAGPVYRIKKNFAAIAGGDLTADFTLRNKDQLKDLAAEIEVSVDSFAHTIHSLRQAVSALKSAVTDEERSRHLHSMESTLSQYKTVRDQ